MAHGRYRLSAKTVERVKEPGVLLDGGGLRLRVAATGEGSERHVTKRWLLRVMVGGVSRELGLGAFPDVRLEQARTKAEEAAQALRNGMPAVVVSGAVGGGRRPTFASVFEEFFKVKAPTLSNEKHAAQWRSTLEVYVFPKLGTRPIADIRPAEVIEVLTPIWNTKAETAHRVLQRMRAVFEWAILHEQRERADPTIGIAKKLGTKHRRVEHFESVPYQEVPTFMAQLRAMPATPARLALQFAILTACRSGEARLAVWGEIDTKAAAWVISPERTKMRREHVAPLSTVALAVLEEAKRLPRPQDCELIFPGQRKGKPLSDMALLKVMRDMGLEAVPHGFRSSFRTWCAETNACRAEVAEAALAHAIKDKVEAAYRRAAYLVERTTLMQAWADYILGGRKGARIRPGVRRAKTAPHIDGVNAT